MWGDSSSAVGFVVKFCGISGGSIYLKQPVFRCSVKKSGDLKWWGHSVWIVLVAAECISVAGELWLMIVLKV